jgi:hypothetical protein
LSNAVDGMEVAHRQKKKKEEGGGISFFLI